jgi:mono/diheme cytochrome c family protein
MSPRTSTRSNRPAVPAQRAWRAVSIGGVALGWTSALIMMAVAVALVAGLGLYNMTALSPHVRLVDWTIHTTMIHSVRNGARSIRAPARFTTQQVQQGFWLYESHCVACHGAPGIARAQWVSGLTPTPPYLLDAARKWSPAELRFIVDKGIKMTAMPAWRLTLSDRDLWRVVAFLERLPGLSPRDYLAMRAAAASKPAAAGQTAHR